MTWRFWKSAFGLLLVGAAGSAAAQDYTAGKTAAQLFQSDCSACHKSPQGLAKSTDQRALVGFLREHYTTKAESAGALAAYVLGAGVADPRQRPPAAGATMPRPGVGAAEGDPGQRQRARANAAPEPRAGEGDNVRPAPRPRVVTAPAGPAAEPAQPPDDEGEPSIMREDQRRSPRAPGVLRDGPRPAANPVDAMASKLRFYGAAGGSVKDTERLADPAKSVESKVESYATSGSPAATPDVAKDAAPGEPGAANAATVPAADAANPAPKRRGSDRRRDGMGAADTAGGTTAGTSVLHSPRRPYRAQGPAIQPPPGNN